jgi:hypothetical protein
LRFKLDGANRKFIADAYGHQIDDDLWDAIVVLTESFINLARDEFRGPPKREILRKLKHWILLCAEMRADLHSGGINPIAVGLDGTLRDIHTIHFEDFSFNRHSDTAHVEFLANILDASMAFGVLFSKHLKQTPGAFYAPAQGGAWEIWINLLRRLLRGKGLMTSVRKDSDVHKRYSAFVYLVYELQKNIPEEMRRFQHSLGALSQGIYRAWHPSFSGTKPRKKRRR